MPFINSVYAAPEEGVNSGATVVVPISGNPLAPLGITLDRFIPQLINFVIVLAVVWWLILKPLTKKMAERQKLIDDSLVNAQKIQDKMTKSEREYQDRIDQAKVESNKLLEKATAEADTVSNAMKIKAKKDIELLIEQAKRNLAIEKEDMMAAVKKESANLIILALEKVLSDKLTPAADKKNTEAMVKQIPYEKK